MNSTLHTTPSRSASTKISDLPVNEQLDIARDWLQNLSTIVDSLPQVNPEAFDGAINFSDKSALFCQEQLEVFKNSVRAADDELAHPTLRVAMIGVTSSGKSTLLNALIAHRLAPIEKGEMSAGIVTFAHTERDDTTIIVHAPSSEELKAHPAWKQAGEYLLRDADAYELLMKEVMQPYHEAKKRRNLEAPAVTVKTRLLAKSNPALLNLPNDVAIEFVDLPGLKNIADANNLRVIQGIVGKAFTIVVIDANETDDEKRGTLLKELEDTVKMMGGRIDTIQFVLNKVDQLRSDDKSVEERIFLLQKEISEVLSLPSVPEIIPFSARKLYNIQCSYGPELSPLPGQERPKHLIAEYIDKDGEYRRLMNEFAPNNHWLDAACDDASTVTEEHMKLLLADVKKRSGADKLWSELRLRVQSRFAQVVIFPALKHLLDDGMKFCNVLIELSQICQLENEKELQEKIERIKRELDRILQTINDRAETYTIELQDALGHITSSTTVSTTGLDISQNIEALKNLSEKPDSLVSLPHFVTKIREDIVNDTIRPIRDALRNGSHAALAELPVNLRNGGLTHNDVYRVNKAVAHYLDVLREHNADAQKGIELKIDKNVDQSVRKADVARLAQDALYVRVQEALNFLGHLLMQRRAAEFEEALLALMEGIYRKIVDEVRPYTEIFAFSPPSFEYTIRDISLSLPDKLFALPDSEKERQVTETVSKTTRVLVKKGSFCGSDQYENKKVSHTVSATYLKLKSANVIAEEWEKGVAAAHDLLWRELTDWINQAVKEMIASLKGYISAIADQLTQQCEERIKLLRQDAAGTSQRWKDTEHTLVHANKHLGVLLTLLNEEASPLSQGIITENDVLTVSLPV